MEKIYLKDKADFLKHYEKPYNNKLKEIVAWRDSIVQGKVDVKIMLPSYRSETIKVLDKIKD